MSKLAIMLILVTISSSDAHSRIEPHLDVLDNLEVRHYTREDTKRKFRNANDCFIFCFLL
jgi:hypothetical protein